MHLRGGFFLLVGLLGLIVACSDSNGINRSDSDEKNRIEEIKSAFFDTWQTPFDTLPTQGEIESFRELFWNASSDRLYFSSRAPKGSKKLTYLRCYDLQTRDIEEIDAGSVDLNSFTIDDFENIAANAIDYDSKKFSIFLYQDGNAQTYEHPNVEIYGPPFFASDSDSAKLIFFGCGPESGEVFLWSQQEAELQAVTPFTDKPSEAINYYYRRFARSYVQGRIVFDYYLEKGAGDSLVRTYNFGAMDIERGKAWRIINHGEGINRRVDINSWFSSKTEDAIYFFTRDESQRLDALWKIDSLGKNMAKVLDGMEIGNPYWYAVVSWSADGRKFCLSLDESESEFRTSIYMVDIGSKKMTGLIYDVLGANFALSPDGKKIAYVSENNALYLFNIETGTRERIRSAEY